jgi:hypothetical protein
VTKNAAGGPVIVLRRFFYELTHIVWGVEMGVFFALINRN